MNLKDFNSFIALSKSSLKLIKAGGDPPDCDTIPTDLRRMVGCGLPITPPDC